MLSHRPIVFTSSARPEGCTVKAVALAMAGIDCPIVDLSTKNFSDYDPDQKNQGDEFLAIAEQMVQHNPIILACPVYWYSVPAVMKRFIDRWSDLLGSRKDIGRKLENKGLLVIAPYGTYPEGTVGFEGPIKNIAQYMGMRYKGCFFYYTGEDARGKAENAERLDKFRAALFK
jgi:putative NADPH-quinone reductase